MTLQNQKRITLAFVGALIVAGVVHIAANVVHNTTVSHYSASTLLFCLEFLIYAVLLFSWVQSIRVRLLPTKARLYLITISILMIVYLAIRAFKYRIAGEAVAVRLAWYGYYVPMLLIPTLFLMVCICIARGDRTARWDERLLIIPAAVLAAVILTNDLHHLVFVPKSEVVNFLGQAGTYTYRLPFYLAYVWMILMLILGVALLVRVCGRGKNKRKLLFIVFDLLLWFFLLRLHDINYIRFSLIGHRVKLRFIPPFESPEIHVFCLLAAFEFCIRERLIPHNENYAAYFAKIPLPVLVTDRELQPALRSASELSADAAQLREATTAPTYPQPDLKLSGRRIRGGYAFWLEDESAVRSTNESLREANELLESENTLIEYENRQKEENAYLRSRHHIYHEIAEKMYPYQKRIEELLIAAQPGKESFRDSIATVSVLNAYVKRKTNLLLLSSDNDTIELRELQLAVSESGRYLTYAGLKTSVDERDFAAPEGSFLPSDTVIALYDTFEMIVEQLLGRATLLMVSFSEEGLTMATVTDAPIRTDDAALSVTTEDQEDILYLTVRAKKGGD